MKNMIEIMEESAKEKSEKNEKERNAKEKSEKEESEKCEKNEMVSSRERILSEEKIAQYLEYLRTEERAVQTIQKYAHDLRVLRAFVKNEGLTKELLIQWKSHLMESYASTSVNTMLAATNGFLEFMEWHDLKVKNIKCQRQIFYDEERELTREEYVKLLKAAQKLGKTRIFLVMQTICGTGIRVSELQYITAEAVRKGRAEVACKGKRRIIFLPNKLKILLLQYLKQQKRTRGAVFVTKNGKPLDRSNIWKEMKLLCEYARIHTKKVFPHNLRHLFARTYYSLEKDLSRLADILGHSNISTTRIYTMESGSVHAKQLNHMQLVLTT